MLNRRSFLKVAALSMAAVCVNPTFLIAADEKLMLAKTWDWKQDVSGWLMSEKLDGVRGYWDGKKLTSKSGKDWNAPKCFTKGLPPWAVEGEVMMVNDPHANMVYKRGAFQEVQSKTSSGDWGGLIFCIFDTPSPAREKFSVRMQRTLDWVEEKKLSHIFIIRQMVVKSNDHLISELRRVEKFGAEGMMVRKDTAYVPGRTTIILKVKTVSDAEAKVLSHNLRDNGTLKSLNVTWNNNKFKIGGGFSEEERRNPPAVGAMVTFKYRGLYKSGKPKFAAFVRVRKSE